MIRTNIFATAKKINRPLLLDGAMGSLLEQRKIITKDLLWSTNANIRNPEEVLKIHKDYIAAGADIITANTFRTNPHTLKQNGISNFSKYIRSATKIALEAVGSTNVLIAGSNPPAEDCYKVKRNISKQKLELNHSYHIEKLWDSSVHFILNETQSHWDEIKFISNFCSINNIDYVMSLYVTPKLKILSGEKITEVIKLVIDFKPLTVSFNCMSPLLFKLIYDFIDPALIWGAYLNCFNKKNASLDCSISPHQYSEFCKKLLSKKPSLLGSCCGSSPEFTKTLRRTIDENT